MDRFRGADRALQGRIVGNIDRRLANSLVGKTVERFGMTGNEQKRMSRACEFGRHRPADAVTCAGDHDKRLFHAIPFRTKSRARCPMLLSMSPERGVSFG
jgi:hypothetical protein